MFNGVGSRIWELADGQNSIDGIVDTLVEEYAVERAEAEAAVLQFVDELVNKGLLTFAE